MAAANLFYPSSSVVTDLSNPAGTNVLDVGNSAHDVTNNATKSHFTSADVAGTNRLVYTNTDLSDRVRVGDMVVINIDGTDYTKTVLGVDTITGAVTFTDLTPTIAQINAGTTIMVDVVAEPAVLTGNLNGVVLGADGTTTVILPGTKDTTRMWGDIYSANNDTLVFQNGTDGTNAYMVGDVRATNGSTVVLDSGTDGTDAEFYGNAETVSYYPSASVSGGNQTDGNKSNLKIVELTEADYALLTTPETNTLYLLT